MNIKEAAAIIEVIMKAKNKLFLIHNNARSQLDATAYILMIKLSNPKQDFIHSFTLYKI